MKLIDSLHFSGVIVFGSDQEVAELMKAVKRMNATGHFNWIGSDGWSARALVSEGKKETCGQNGECLFFSVYYAWMPNLKENAEKPKMLH